MARDDEKGEAGQGSQLVGISTVPACAVIMAVKIGCALRQRHRGVTRPVASSGSTPVTHRRRTRCGLEPSQRQPKNYVRHEVDSQPQ
jgi:hypothetical protein